MPSRHRQTVLLVPLLAVPLWAAYPPLEWNVVAWGALAPVAWLLKHGSGGTGRWVAAGWGFGMIFFGYHYGWAPRAMVTLGGLEIARFVPFAATALALLALLPAVAWGAVRWLWRRYGVTPYATLPVLLCAMDWALGHAPFGGMPWGSLAATQADTWAARLVVPWAGGAGLVLVIGAVNGAWAIVLEGWQAGRVAVIGRALAALATTILCAGPWGGPASPLPEPSHGRSGFRAMLVPGNFSGVGGSDATRVRQFMAATLEGLAAMHDGPPAARPNLVIWPEASVAGHANQDGVLADVRTLARAAGADVLFGGDALLEGRSRNAAFLVRAAGAARYDKQRLVPFGEYVPRGFRWVFGRKATAGEADYVAGSGPPVLPWRGHALGMAICFESILPQHMRALALGGAELVVAIANQDWLTPAAKTHHLRLTALRALEIGRDAVFVSNRGWSGLLADGRVVGQSGGGAAPQVVRPRPRAALTPWVRWEPWPLLGFVAVWSAIAAWRWWRRDRAGGG